MIDDDGEDEFSKFVIPTGPKSPRPLRQRSFAPWHEPRKQWVRLFQWRDEVERLLETVTFSTGAEILRYLGLPGEDMFDIRLLRELCEKRRIDLHYTGLVAAGGRADRDQLNLSETAIKRLPNIRSSSHIVVDRFEAIGQPTPAQNSVRASGPYHIVNADLTGHFAAKAFGGEGKTYVEALGEIIQIQTRSSRDPWLLFLTTRLDPNQVHASNMSAFIRAVQSNISSSETFREGMAELLMAEGDGLSQSLSNPENLSQETFKDLFCVSFGKWLLAYVQSGTPRQSVQMLESCYYSVKNRHDMLSLGFLISPSHRSPGDIHGLLPVQQAQPEPAEIELGLALLNSTKELFDLDSKIDGDPGLAEQMTVETLLLLAEANYPVQDGGAEYRDWLSHRKSGTGDTPPLTV